MYYDVAGHLLHDFFRNDSLDKLYFLQHARLTFEYDMLPTNNVTIQFVKCEKRNIEQT